MRDTKARLSLTTIALHWIVGISIIILMVVGKYMEVNEVFKLYPLHKSIGTIIFIFVVWRVVWRLINGWPEKLGQYATWEVVLAKIVHWVLIIGTVLFPLSGMMMSVMGGHGLSVFGLELISANIVDGKPFPLNKAMAGNAAGVHGILLPIMIVAIALHIIGAYKHHIIDKDNTMYRILGRNPR